MSDRRPLVPPAELGRVHADLLGHGYAVTSDQAIGLPDKFRHNFVQTYFVDSVIRHDEGDWPVDRKRARDVVRYEWHGDELRLDEYETILIKDRAGIKGKREHARVWLLDDPQAAELIRNFLALIPPAKRQSAGTFGVNLFRTYTNVVTKPHHDDEQFIFIYVVDRIGSGAETSLYHPGSVADGQATAPPSFHQQLQPGELIVFDDVRYMHDASPLVPTPDGRAMRDALVCTVDFERTYLKPRPLSVPELVTSVPESAPEPAVRTLEAASVGGS